MPTSFGFFTLSDNNVTKAVQIGNAIAAGLTIYGYFTNPEASFREYGFDIGVHVLQAFMNEHSQPLAVLGADAANTLRMLAIVKNLAFGSSSIPTWLNLTDVLIHAGNVLNNSTLDEPRPSRRMS